MSYKKLSQNQKAYTFRISNTFVPRNIKEALDHPDWNLTVTEETNTLNKNDTCEIVELARDKTVVGYKWLSTIKCNADGNVKRYKARLVTKGFHINLWN